MSMASANNTPDVAVPVVSHASIDTTGLAEKISIRMQQLETALQRGDETEAKLARNELKTLAGEWVDAPAT